MRHSLLDFTTIERAISCSIEALRHDGVDLSNHPALEKLANAQEELKRALSISMSRMNGQ
jgi:hypothetical protein